MKKFWLVVGFGLYIIVLTGCARIIPHPVKVEKVIGLAPLPSYSGPKAKITLADFEVKTTKATSEISASLREKLISVLVNSNRFSIVERQVQGADLILTVAITEFEPQGSGGSAGLGGGGGAGSGVLGGLLGVALNKALMTLDIRIVDTSTSKILARTRVQGKDSDMEKAISICVIETVRYISGAIPESYYKY